MGRKDVVAALEAAAHAVDLVRDIRLGHAAPVNVLGEADSGGIDGGTAVVIEGAAQKMPIAIASAPTANRQLVDHGIGEADRIGIAPRLVEIGLGLLPVGSRGERQ